MSTTTRRPSHLDPFRECVFQISEHLSQSDLTTLLYLYKLPQSYRSEGPLGVLHKLQRMGEFSASNPNRLEVLLNKINRSDLTGMVKNYTDSEIRIQVAACHAQTENMQRHLAELEKMVRAEFVRKPQTRLNDSFSRLHKEMEELATSLANLARCGEETQTREEPAQAVVPVTESRQLQRAQPGPAGANNQKVLPPTAPKPRHSSTTSPKPAAQIRGQRPKTALLPPSHKPEQPPPDTDNDYDDVLPSDCSVIPVEETVGHYYASRDLTADRPDLQHYPNLKMSTSNRLTLSAPSSPVPAPRHLASLPAKRSSKIPIPKCPGTPPQATMRESGSGHSLAKKYTRGKQVSVSEASDYSGSDYTGSTGSYTGSGSADSGFSSASPDVREWKKHTLSSSQDSEIRPTPRTSRKPQQQLYTPLSHSGMNYSPALYQPVPKARSPGPHHS